MPPAPLTLAAHTVPDPREAPPVRWGVLAPGGIANVFADAVHEGTRSRVVAVGSRSLERAQEFAGRHGVERPHGSYAELVNDPDWAIPWRAWNRMMAERVQVPVFPSTGPASQCSAFSRRCHFITLALDASAGPLRPATSATSARPTVIHLRVMPFPLLRTPSSVGSNARPSNRTTAPFPDLV